MPVASAAAEPPLEPPGVRSCAQGLRVAPRKLLSVCQRNAKIGQVGSRQRNGAGSFQLGYDRRVLRQPAPLQTPARPRSWANPARRIFSFTASGTPVQGSQDFTRGLLRISGRGRGACFVGMDDGNRVHPVVDCVNALDTRLDRVTCAGIAIADSGGQVERIQLPQVCHK